MTWLKYLPLLSELVAAIVRAGKDPRVELRRMTDGYDAKERAEAKWADAIDKKFPRR